ncbi:MAG: hypothetical protein JST85_20920 [Acidobacteria bacterium]|nr:hypothetical protein [Acidobacteriota bacterium]
MTSIKKTAAFSVILSLIFSTFFPTAQAFASANYVGIATPLELPAAKAGQVYSYQFEAEGGLPPLTWKILRGDVPQELTLTSSGKLHGTLTQSQPKIYLFMVEVKDSSASPQTFSEEFSLNILPAPLRIISGQKAPASGLHISVTPKPLSPTTSSIQMNVASENTNPVLPASIAKIAGNTQPDDPPNSATKRKVSGRLRPSSLDEVFGQVISNPQLTNAPLVQTKLCEIGFGQFRSACANQNTRNAEATIELLELLLDPPKAGTLITANLSTALLQQSHSISHKKLRKLIDLLSNVRDHDVEVRVENSKGKLINTTTCGVDGTFEFDLADNDPENTKDDDDYYVLSTEADNYFTKRTIVVSGKDLEISLPIEDHPSSLLARAVVGYQQAGAASTSFEQNYFFDLFISQSLPFRQKVDPHFGEAWRTWGAIRAISAPQSGNVTIGDLSTNFVAKVKELKANEAARVFDYLGGIEFRLPFSKNLSRLPSFDGQTKQKFTLSLIADGGFVTPTNPNDAQQKSYKISDEFRTRFKAEAKGSELLTGNELDGKDYVAFVPTDRDRFFRQYYAGIRMQTFFFNRHDVPLQRFPVQLDLQYGINEYVTGGRARGGVFRLDGYFPLPYDKLNFINLFGTAIFRPVRSKIEKTIILEEVDGKFFDGKTATLPVSQFNRDYYRVGVGIDFVSFIGKLLASH